MECTVRRSLPEGEAEIVFEVYPEDGKIICGLLKLNGSIPQQPKAWLRTVRREMRVLEQIVKDAGAVEMRVAGRDWSRVLTDYERYDGPNHGLRKVL